MLTSTGVRGHLFPGYDDAAGKALVPGINKADDDIVLVTGSLSKESSILNKNTGVEAAACSKSSLILEEKILANITARATVVEPSLIALEHADTVLSREVFCDECNESFWSPQVRRGSLKRALLLCKGGSITM